VTVVVPREVATIDTPRLRLRAVRADDVEAIWAYGRDVEVARYVSWEPHRSKEDTRAFVASVLHAYTEGQTTQWGIEERSSGEFVGMVGLAVNEAHRSAEVGYVLRRDRWGQGYVTEATKAAIAFGFDRLGLHRIQIRMRPENVGSWKVAERCGCRFEGITRAALFARGEPQDLMVWSVLRTDPRPK
jgi:ribosomal-protein-alanine N-acetyltransferase